MPSCGQMGKRTTLRPQGKPASSASKVFDVPADSAPSIMIQLVWHVSRAARRIPARNRRVLVRRLITSRTERTRHAVNHVEIAVPHAALDRRPVTLAVRVHGHGGSRLEAARAAACPDRHWYRPCGRLHRYGWLVCVPGRQEDRLHVGSGSPAPSFAADSFSARWTGEIEPRYSETYKLSIISDDGVRLWLEWSAADRQLDGALREGRRRLLPAAGGPSLCGEARVLRKDERCDHPPALVQFVAARQVVPPSQLYPTTSGRRLLRTLLHPCRSRAPQRARSSRRRPAFRSLPPRLIRTAPSAGWSSSQTARSWGWTPRLRMGYVE